MVLPYLERSGAVPAPAPPPVRAAVRRILECAGDRIKTAGDILDYRYFFLPDEKVPLDEAAFEKRIRRPPEAAGLLSRFRERLAGQDPWTAPALEALMRNFVEDEKIALGQIIHAVRVAVTGRAEGFGLFETLEIAGRDRTLARLDRALSRLKD